MTKFYIADNHFGHENIIKFDNRPFVSIEVMNQEMLLNWNRAVSPSDEVYILGDIYMKMPPADFLPILKKLNGHKHLIVGNHDRLNEDIRKQFVTISEIKEIRENNYRLFLCHYPVHMWNGNWHENSIHLYGHVHETMEYYETLELSRLVSELNPMKKGEMINVGAMMPWMDYTPRTLQELL